LNPSPQSQPVGEDILGAAVAEPALALRAEPANGLDAPRFDQAQGWQPIETAPLLDLVYVLGAHPDGSWWWNIGYRAYDDVWAIAELSLEPTHWMPLPPPPVEDQAA